MQTNLACLDYMDIKTENRSGHTMWQHLTYWTYETCQQPAPGMDNQTTLKEGKGILTRSLQSIYLLHQTWRVSGYYGGNTTQQRL